MKKLLFSALFGLFFLTAQAQQENIYDRYMKAEQKMEYRNFILETLALNKQEILDFDPVFRAYISEKSKVVNELTPIVHNYVASYATMTDKELEVFNVASGRLNAKLDAIEKQYHPKLYAALPVRKATNFFLLEKVIENSMEQELLENLFVNVLKS